LTRQADPFSVIPRISASLARSSGLGRAVNDGGGYVLWPGTTGRLLPSRRQARRRARWCHRARSSAAATTAASPTSARPARTRRRACRRRCRGGRSRRRNAPLREA
jgi:hypothetical protein